jgi:2-polyprenyl-3-methyl-5-hydroxy-6-metoxy-1,4-benzoquinol methylase
MASSFPRLSEERRAYLDAVERLIVSAIPPGSRSLLDIGAGDGVRSLRIACAAGLQQIVLLEPSAEMRKSWPAHVTAWPVRAEDLHAQRGQFDAITCLWNVLGHIFPASARSEVIRQCARLLAPGGRIFIDVNYRYNANHYGVAPTAWRFLRDRAAPSGSTGDVVVTWQREGVSTAGHVFTGTEFAELCRTAGVRIEQRFVVDYATGAVRRWSFQGHLLYVLRA